MSSRPESQQHLTSANMAMVDRALARVGLLYKFERRSEDEAQIAAVMVGEFQRGNDTEDGLYAIFLGPSDIAMHVQRKQHMKRALDRWEDEGGANGPRELAA